MQLERLIEAVEKKRIAETEYEDARKEAIAYLEENNITDTSCNGYRITRKVRKGMITLDSKAIKVDHPAIYDKYSRIGEPYTVIKSNERGNAGKRGNVIWIRQ